MAAHRAPLLNDRQAGLSMIEFALASVIIGSLIATAVSYTQAAAMRYERAAFEYSVNRLRASVALKFASLAMAGELAAVARLNGGNPMDWMETPLPGYIGRIDTPGPEPIEGGSWFYDGARSVLVYVPRYAVGDTSALPARVRLRVESQAPTDAAYGLPGLVVLDPPPRVPG